MLQYFLALDAVTNIEEEFNLHIHHHRMFLYWLPIMI